MKICSVIKKEKLKSKMEKIPTNSYSLMVLNSKATAENVRLNQGLQVSLFSSNFLFTYPVLSLFSVNKYKCMVYSTLYDAGGG